jgi:hypothetical protein
VGIDAAANTVKLDPAVVPTVGLDPDANTVKLDPSTNAVSVFDICPVTVENLVNAWSVYDTDTNALAVATKASETGNAHLVQAIIGGYSDAAVVGTMTLKFGTDVIMVYPFTGNAQVVLPFPLLAPNETAVSVELSAGGESKIGYVTLVGSTRPAPLPPPEP